MSVLTGADVGAATAELLVNWEIGEPEVSVLVTTHNHGRYLGATLTAVADQQGADVELIVVDDASGDETESVVRAFAREASIPFAYVRLPEHSGQAVGRNKGMELSRGRFLAFTDADCVPSPTWIKEAMKALERPSVGMVQGRTKCQVQHPAMLTHFIETLRFDGSFSTSNIVYRRTAIQGHRFDPSCAYWEDTDLGFRVCANGWQVDFAPEALVYHQAVPQSVRSWVTWPTRYSNWPAKAARYPDFRRTLFLRLWVRPLHACFDVAVAGALTAVVGRRRRALLLLVPYALAFAGARGLRGRAPVLKVLLYLARDVVALGSLVAGSIRYRRVVL